MKKYFETPAVTVVRLEAVDIVTTSGESIAPTNFGNEGERGN